MLKGDSFIPYRIEQFRCFYHLWCFTEYPLYIPTAVYTKIEPETI